MVGAGVGAGAHGVRAEPGSGLELFSSRVNTQKEPPPRASDSVPGGGERDSSEMQKAAFPLEMIYG